MKLPLAAALTLAFGCTDAFAPVSRYHKVQSTAAATTTSQLHLFGGGNKGGDGGAKKAPGMMDQLAMFKKMSEMAQKKNKLDTELAAETFEGTAADGKVKAICKFSPSKNPLDPQPDFETTGFEFDDEWYESVSPEDLSAAVMEAIKDGTEKTSQAVTEKYKVLEEDVRGALGGALGEAAAASES
ncbi:YbaB/EbfC DNA-binding family protein [Nitzschia inconspicua]|uniref:YbaB/EbfC DNA-binding family protein n=1 Tax=Nitzschia inconspicua TaxID=303405 RepID=A0A9K3KNU8_9STRA|nr:YbaB/EbfC DNA-binding family protein [Nitzschia inconspicua]